MTAVIAIAFCIAPFALCLLMALRQQAKEADAIYQFERGWGPHNQHEWVEHPVYKGRFVCRYCPVARAE